MNDINVEINNFGPIHKANINIANINVVSGYNATGKSTISKLLYCIFKATSEKRQTFAYDSLMPRINIITAKLNDKQHFIFANRKKSLKDMLDDYENAKNNYFQFVDYDDSRTAYYLEDIEIMDNILKVVNQNGFGLYKSILKSLIESEFLINKIYGNFKISGSFNNRYFNYFSDFSSNNFSSEGDVSFYDVFYIDSFSFFDIFNSRRSKLNNYFYTHDEYLKKILQKNKEDIVDIFDSNINENAILIENKLKRLIKGEIKYENGKFLYYSNNLESYPMKNTSLGFNRIGIIQMLLSNRELKENSLLIIDEPELHLDPILQQEMAAILVVLAKCLDVLIYINTYSPAILEWLDYFCAYYNFKGSLNFYLTEPAKEEGKFNLNKVEYDKLLNFLSINNNI